MPRTGRLSRPGALLQGFVNPQGRSGKNDTYQSSRMTSVCFRRGEQVADRWLRGQKFTGDDNNDAGGTQPIAGDLVETKPCGHRLVVAQASEQSLS
jgi:hypothetical protein